jgi:predicted dehydrogenase
MKNKFRLAMIGCGNISNFHVNALKNIKLNIFHCASSLKSTRVKAFAKKYNIPNIWEDPIKLAKSSKEWDGIILCSSTKTIPKLLDILIDQKKPILVEKPVSVGTDYLKKFKFKSPKFVNVAYNRRYYYTVLKAKEFVKKSKGQIICNLKLPEKVIDNKKIKKKFINIFENSAHGIDTLRFIFGDLKVLNNYKIKLNNFDSSRIAILQSKDNHICNIVISANSPDNFSLELENGFKRFVMKPFENYEIYEGMEIVNPVKRYPLRVYRPNIIIKENVFSEPNINPELKPGFSKQAIDFYRLLNGKKDISAAKLTDAYKAQYLIEKIMLS